VMKLVQEDSAVVLSETAVNQNKMMSPLWQTENKCSKHYSILIPPIHLVVIC
jgi:hypothetical protein